jgi:hypothetical protein
VSLGCVVRVESTEQDLRRVGKDKSCRRMLPGRSPCEVPVTGTCGRERPGVECLRGMKPRDGRCYDGTGCRVFR